MGDGSARWRLWVDVQAPRALLLLLLDDSKGNPSRPALVPTLWSYVARFLRFPAPMQMVYVLGGRRPGLDALEECVDTAEFFDWWCGEWVPIPNMSSARVGAAAAVLGHLVVVAGGYCADSSRPLRTVEAFDPLEGRWRMLPPMLTPRYGLVLANVLDQIFAIGGDDGQRVCTANEVYSLGEASWERAAPLLKPLAGGKAETHAGMVYYVGGCEANQELSAATLVYTPQEDRWDYACMLSSPERLNLRIARASFAMGLIGAPSAAHSTGSARLVVIGGISGRADDFFVTDTELLALASPAGMPRSDAFCTAHTSEHAAWFDVNEVPPMPQPRSGCRSIVLWPTPKRPFLPWSTSLDCPYGSNAKPYVVVLGGEAPNQETGLTMRPCPDPIVLDVVGGSWYLTQTHSTEELSGSQTPSTTVRGDDQQFLQAVGKLRISRAAFAITVAEGLPRAAAQWR